MDENRDKENDDSSSENRPRVPPIQRWSDLMDDIIDEAVSEGFFDNLPGEGKPLNLKKHPFSSDTELAHELLKANDYTLPWITERSTLLQAAADLRSRIGQQWSRIQDEYRVSESETIRMSLKLGWANQIEQWSQEIQKLNQQIAAANLKQPGSQLEIMKLTLDSELAKIGAGQELG